MNGPTLVRLVSELLLNKTPSTGPSHCSVILDANLGDYKARLSQLKTINGILWKNIVAVNSERFDRTANDLRTLRCSLKDFLLACDKAEADAYLKKYIEKNKKSTSKQTIESEYLKPLEDLRKVYEKLETDTSSQNRGKAWALLGYLQAFVFGNMGFIDPVYKVRLKLRYLDDDISDCKNTIYVAKLYSRVLGLMDERALHPRLEEIEKSLEKLTAEREMLQNQKAVRPSNSEFIALSKEFANFRHALGSYSIVEKHIKELIESLSRLEYQVRSKYFDFN